MWKDRHRGQTADKAPLTKVLLLDIRLHTTPGKSLLNAPREIAERQDLKIEARLPRLPMYPRTLAKDY